MPAIVRLNKQGLNDLVNKLKENGGNSGELEDLLSEVIEDENARRPVRRVRNPLREMGEEPTTEERLEAEVGGLFPGGITEPILAEVIEMDRKYTVKELREMSIDAGLSPSGHKKELAAKLIAKRIR